MANTRTNVAVSVTTSATSLAATNNARVRILIFNNSAQTVFIGDVNVTTANGIPIAAGSYFADQAADGGPADSAFGQQWYGIVASTTADCRVMES